MQILDTLRMALEALDEPSYKTEKEVEAITALRAQIEALEKVEPVAWVDLLSDAQEVVRNKPHWKRWIDGNPLSNDIAVWMADFAEKYTAPTPPAAIPALTSKDILAGHIIHGSIGNVARWAYALAAERAGVEVK